MKEQLLDVRSKENRFDSLTKMQIWAYGVGHYINDLVAACWFNYLFFFLKYTVETPAASAAILAGQVTDGIATPIVGYLSDKCKTRFGNSNYLFRSKNAMVCVWISTCFSMLFAYLSNLPKRK